MLRLVVVLKMTHLQRWVWICESVWPPPWPNTLWLLTNLILLTCCLPVIVNQHYCFVGSDGKPNCQWWFWHTLWTANMSWKLSIQFWEGYPNSLYSHNDSFLSICLAFSRPTLHKAQAVVESHYLSMLGPLQPALGTARCHSANVAAVNQMGEDRNVNCQGGCPLRANLVLARNQARWFEKTVSSVGSSHLI